MRQILCLMILVLPWALRRRALSALFGYEIAPSARIGLSLVLARRAVLEAGSRIGHFNVIKGLDVLHLGESAKIGNLNRITGVPAGDQRHFADEANRIAEFAMGEHASLTSRHFVDCCNSVRIGGFTTVAGASTQIISHGIDIQACRQRSGPVSIGRYCYVGTACVIVKGGVLPDYCVLAANSSLHRAQTQTHSLYSGVPAEPVRQLDPSAAYFHRTTGRVP